MIVKQCINLDEIYDLLANSQFDIKDRYVLSVVANNQYQPLNGQIIGFKIIDLIKQTIFFIPGNFGVHNLNSIYVESWDAVLTTSKIYDIESGGFLSSWSTNEINIDCGTASDLFYLVKENKVQVVDRHGNSTDVYIRSDNDFISGFKNDSLVVGSANSIIFIKNYDIVHCELRVPVGGFAYPTKQGIIIIITLNDVAYKLYDVSTKTIIEGSFVDYAIDVELSEQGLVYITRDGLYLNQERLLQHKPKFVYWTLLKAFCSGGFEDIKLLTSLTPRQLLTLYIDQLVE